VAQYAFVVIQYKVPLERILQTVDRHRAYLGSLYAQGKLVASGPLVPRTGGGILFRVADDAELSQLLAADPFQVEGLVETTRFHWAPGIGVDGLDQLAPAPK
jgi:uncharacterized protein YciI